jgi:topoisomerase IV subunit A
MSSLEKIFIEKRIYHLIENSETWEAVITTIDKGLDPYKKLLMREVTRDDIIQLTEIKIKRISKFDIKKADEHIKGLETELAEVKNHLEKYDSLCHKLLQADEEEVWKRQGEKDRDKEF